MGRTAPRRILLSCSAALALAVAASAAPPAPPDCATVAACIDRLRQRDQNYSVREAIEDRLIAFGTEAVDALVPLLGDADPRRREMAGMVLARFERIDPRHLPALLAAYRAGNGWLPRAIAATGTDAALEFLQQEFLEDPDFASNAQVHFALARFGDRVRPFVLAQLDRCRTSDDYARCNGLIALLKEFPAFPAWALEPLAGVSRSAAASREVRSGAERALIDLRHPAGLEALVGDLEEARRFLSGRTAEPVHPQLESAAMRDSHVALTIRDIGRFGASARQVAPLLLWFLERPELPDARAAAALALGRVGDASAAAALLPLEPDFADNWLLAYNAVESLGRLRISEARPLLERAVRGHWHRPVRNNAERALSALGGGAFERPGVPRDGAPFEESDDPDAAIIYAGDLRYRGDRDLPSWCAVERGASVSLQQNPVGGLRFPRSGTRFLTFRGLSEREARPLSAARPELADGQITAVVPTRDGLLVGYARGDEGSLFHSDERGGVRQLIDDRVGFGFRLGGRLYFVTGSVHALSTWGAVWEIDAAVPRIVRRIGLPAHAYRAAVSSARAIVLETGEGALAIREDGSLADPALLGGCPPDA